MTPSMYKNQVLVGFHSSRSLAIMLLRFSLSLSQVSGRVKQPIIIDMSLI